MEQNLDLFPEINEEENEPVVEEEKASKENEPVIEEYIKCQYCEDVGECMYCKRGREEYSKNREKTK